LTPSTYTGGGRQSALAGAPGMEDSGPMGQEVSAKVFSREDRQRYRQKVRSCLDVFARMLAEARFDADRRSVGLEIELNLTDDAGDPALTNQQALDPPAYPTY